MMNLIPVDGKPGLARDANTGFVHNINSASDAESFRLRKTQIIEARGEVLRLSRDVECLQNDVKDIKHLLNQILEKL